MNRQLHFEKLIESFQNLRRGMMEYHARHNDELPYGKKAALFMIANEKQINVKRLSEMLHVTSGAATQHIESLEVDGYVKRTMADQDRRGVLVQLTPKGRSLYTKLHASRLSKLEQLFSDINDGDLETYVRISQTISDKIQRGEY